MSRPRTPIPGVVYHPPEVVERYLAAGVLTRETLGGALHRAAQRHAERTALVSPADGVRWSYRALDELSDRAAAALLELGLRPLDAVMFQIGNVPEFFVALYGCFKAGIIPVCTLIAHREGEVGFIAEFVSARAHLVQGDLAFDLVGFGRDIAAKAPSLRHLLAVRGGARAEATDLFALIDAQDPSAARRRIEALALDPFNVGIYQLSGGTTGIPKVIPRFHAEYLCNVRSWAEMSRLDETTISFWPLPAIHNAAMVAFNTPVHLTGGTVVVHQSHDPASFLGTIAGERVTFSGAALPIVVRAVDSGLVGNYDLSSVECFITLGETPLVERGLGVRGHHIFGMAEGMCMRTLPEDPAEVRASMIGRPISRYDEVNLVRPRTEEPVAPGEVGEFLARGPYTIRGYFNAPEHNARTFTADGFYRSGDLMRAHVIDGVTYYAFEGRAKDNIDRGMEKISAEEVERAVIQHPAIREVLVIGMPDREMGERVCAYVIAESGRTAPAVHELGRFLEGIGLAKFKWPERIEAVENFPATSVGKTSKALLREDIVRKLEKEGASPPGHSRA